MQTVRFEPVINLGQIVTLMTMALTLGTLVWKMSEFQARTDLTLAVLTKTVEDVQAPSIERLAVANQNANIRLTAIETKLDITGGAYAP